MSLATQSHRAWLMKMARESDRERLRRVREKLSEARGRKRAAKADARATCLAARDQVRAWAKAERERLQLEIVKLRNVAKQTCVLGREKVEANEGAAVRAALAELTNERDNRRLVQLAKGNAQLKLPAVARKDRESDNERDIVGSLDDEQLIVWNKVRGRIKANDRMTRLEAFEHWLHENPGEVAVILSKHYEQDVERFVKEEEQQRKAMQVDYRKLTDTQLSDRIERTAKADAPKLTAPKAVATPKPKPKRKLSGRPLATKTKKPKGKLRPKTVAPGKGTAAPRAASSRASAASKRKLSRVGVRGAAKPKGKVRPKGKKLAPGTVLIRYGVGLDDAGSYFPIWMPENATEPVRIMFNGAELKDALESAKWKAEEEASGYRGVPVVVEQLPLPRKAGPSSYEQRQQARRERMQGRAGKLAQVADAKLNAARRIGSHIPFGQPILVGHHSEKRARRDIKRIDQNMRAGIEASKKAEQLASRAANVGRAGIASDDPEAVKKLKDKLSRMVAIRDRMKKLNAVMRKGGLEALLAAAESDAERRSLEKSVKDNEQYSWTRGKAFAPYLLTNLSADIRRVEARIAETASLQSTGDRTIQGNGYTISEDADAGRVFVRFDARQSAEVAKLVKRNGFVWARSQGAWVRKRTANAWAAAGHLHAALIRELGSKLLEDDDAPDPQRQWSDTSAELEPIPSTADEPLPSKRRARLPAPKRGVGRKYVAPGKRPTGKLKITGAAGSRRIETTVGQEVGAVESVRVGEYARPAISFSRPGVNVPAGTEMRVIAMNARGDQVQLQSIDGHKFWSHAHYVHQAEVKPKPGDVWDRTARELEQRARDKRKRQTKLAQRAQARAPIGKKTRASKGKLKVKQAAASVQPALGELTAEQRGIKAARKGCKVKVLYSESGAPYLQAGRQYPSLDAFSGGLNRALRDYRPINYDKIGFAIHSELGVYEGRYDLGEAGETRANLAHHVRRALQHRINTSAHTTDNRGELRAWLAFIDDMQEVEAPKSRSPFVAIQPRDTKKTPKRAGSTRKVNAMLRDRAIIANRVENALAVPAAVLVASERKKLKRGKPTTVAEYLKVRTDIDRDGLTSLGESLRLRLGTPESMQPVRVRGTYTNRDRTYGVSLRDDQLVMEMPNGAGTILGRDSMKPNELMLALRKEDQLQRDVDYAEQQAARKSEAPKAKKPSAPTAVAGKPKTVEDHWMQGVDLRVVDLTKKGREELFIPFSRRGSAVTLRGGTYEYDGMKLDVQWTSSSLQLDLPKDGWVNVRVNDHGGMLQSFTPAKQMRAFRERLLTYLKEQKQLKTWSDDDAARDTLIEKLRKARTVPDANLLRRGELLELVRELRVGEVLLPKGSLVSFQRVVKTDEYGTYIEVMDDQGERVRLEHWNLKRSKKAGKVPF